MQWNELEKYFSAARLGRYSSARAGDRVRAASDYANNLLLAEAMLPVLNTVEIALRNGIHSRLTSLYKRPDWWAEWLNNLDRLPLVWDTWQAS